MATMTTTGQVEAYWAEIKTLLHGHHEPIHELLETLIRKQNTMSETFDTAIATLSGKVDTLTTAITQFGSDVAADIASLNSGGTLTQAQQDAVTALNAKVDGLIANVGSLDATVKPAA